MTESSRDVFLVAILIGAGAIYFAPTLIAWRRKTPGAILVAFVNGAFGWTLFGWLLALIWALSGEAIKICPRCAESVKLKALVCRFCGHEFPSAV